MTKEAAAQKIYDAFFEIECAVDHYPELLLLARSAWEVLELQGYDEGEEEE
jgi:hypothetical protein